MPTFEATTSVAAPRAVVWSTLLATERWTSWDPQLDSVAGRLADGERLEIRVKDNPRPFTLKVSTWEPQRRIVLTGGMPLGLFTGTRTYALADGGAGTTVTVRETYTGPLAGLIGRSIPDLQPSFDSFVSGLRRDAEGQDQHR
jgi:uncharacterized protein YndB with AHSA1/START domain